MPLHQVPPTSSQSSTPSNSPKVSSEKAFSSGTFLSRIQAGGANPPGRPPGDTDDDPDKRKDYREINFKRKGRFLIDSTALTSAKGRSRGNMKCEVDRFERGTDFIIKDWINQMETYFTIGQAPQKAFVRLLIMEIVPRQLNEIKQYQSIDYLSFMEKIVEDFQVPDLATAYLTPSPDFPRPATSSYKTIRIARGFSFT